VKVVNVNELYQTERDVRCPHGGFISLRAVLAQEGMGFSVNKTIIPKGKPQHWHYTHHLEACYCVSGRGTITDLKAGVSYEIAPDTIYLLNNHDDHVFRAHEDTVLISIFNPPLTGREVHREDGSYRIDGEENGEMYKAIEEGMNNERV